MSEEALTHVDETGRPRMVDITDKPVTQRQATARGVVRMLPSTLELIQKGSVSKGDVLTTARLAGMMGAKKTHELIPLCHPLLLGDIEVEFALVEPKSNIEITATVKSSGQTGVEMEALTAVTVAALTVYDMCKAVDRGIKIDNIRLIKKSGGKSGQIILE